MAKKKSPASSRRFNKWKKAVKEGRNAERSEEERNTLLLQAFSFLQSGRDQEARQILRQLLSSPDGPPAYLNQLGILAHMIGHSSIGLDLVQRSVERAPSAPFFNNLGLVQEHLGDYVQAQSSYQKALELDGNFATAYFNLGNVLQKKEQYQPALEAYRKAIQLNSNYAAAHTNLANVLLQLNELDEALEASRTALRINPGYKEAVHTWCNVMLRKTPAAEIIGQVEGQFNFLRDKDLIYGVLGDCLADSGKKQDALDSYRKTLVQTGQRGKIFLRMSMLKKFRTDDPDLREMEQEYARAPGLADRNLLCFALGKAYEDIEDYPNSFRYINEANRLTRETYTYFIEEDVHFFKQLQATFTSEFVHRPGITGCHDRSPIFIVGMPRSGTTLVEQILASHSQVYGAGELPELDLIIRKTLQLAGINRIPGGVKDLSPSQFETIGKEYASYTKRLAPGALRIVDKLPHNFTWLGMIRLVLPEAKIIHCKRDPMDTCWSIYKNIFEIPHRYAQDLVELGQYYRLYLELMDHWKSVLPNDIYEIEYEKLIRDQENETRKLLAFCDLPWEEACLNFHEAERRVQTSSLAQVRTPIYSNSVRKWQHFRNELQPLIEIIEQKRGA